MKYDLNMIKYAAFKIKRYVFNKTTCRKNL